MKPHKKSDLVIKVLKVTEKSSGEMMYWVRKNKNNRGAQYIQALRVEVAKATKF
jgi:hypothetical protein